VNYGTPITINEFANNAPAVVPHAAATGALAVGAIPYFDQTNPEANSSRGPETILFDEMDNPITPQVRQVPQVAAIDGVNNTFFGTSDTDGDGHPNFFGTSAAAAHAAGVAALVKQANPGFTPSQIDARLENTATDVGATGFDSATGYGIINAYDAVYPTI